MALGQQFLQLQSNLIQLLSSHAVRSSSNQLCSWYTINPKINVMLRWHIEYLIREHICILTKEWVIIKCHHMALSFLKIIDRNKKQLTTVLHTPLQLIS